MIVYVESNFVLEIAFVREEHDICQTILQLAEANNLQLVLPAFSIGETYEALVRRHKNREELRNKLASEIKELKRSKPYEELDKESERLTSLLSSSGEEEKRRLDEALDRILRAAQIIPLGLKIIRAATVFQKSRSLSPQDSIVYASILEFLDTQPTKPCCFITTNSRDFVNPDILADLANYNCKLLGKFGHGLGYIQSQSTNP